MILQRLALLLLCTINSQAAEPAKLDPALPFRTDSANQNLPWYQLRAGEFPPLHSEHWIGGELIEADFIHRSGQFRMDGTGELVDFTMPPFGAVFYLHTEADLRDVPVGAHFQFALYQDEKGAFTRLVSMADDYTLLAREGFAYRLDEIRPADGKLIVSKLRISNGQIEGSPRELLVNARTHIWKGTQEVKLDGLAIGDQLLVNFAGASIQNPARCSEIRAGAEAQQAATERQRKQHLAFLKARGLPAVIDRVDGKKIGVTLIGDPTSLQALLKDEHIVPAQWATEHRRITTAVANDELRTYNPPVDQQGSNVLEYQELPTDNHGCSGIHWMLQPNLLLEGFRKGRIVRLFAHPSWPVKDMPYGESVYPEVFNSETVETDPLHYPFRTDFANSQLPWFQLRPGEFPPLYSAHQIAGELVKVDPTQRSGQFRADRTGELVNFTLPPFGTISYLNADAELSDVPLGTRCLFSLHPDGKGAFTQASLVTDDFTHLTNYRLTCRIVEMQLDVGLLIVAKQIPAMKNEADAMTQPPDLGRLQLPVNAQTKVWKDGHQAALSDLAAGDELLFNLTGATKTAPGRCTEIWAGVETHRRVTDEQRAKQNDRLKQQGVPGWIVGVEGKLLTVVFFAGNRKDFATVLNGDPWGQPLQVTLADGLLQARPGGWEKMWFKNHLPEGDTAGTYGCSGIRWVFECNSPREDFHPGTILRVLKNDWPATKTAVPSDPPK